MSRVAGLFLLICALGSAQSDGDKDVVFHSDVSLVRVDAQVVDSSNRPIIHLHAGDFVLHEDGKVVPIRNFASDNLPIDVLFLLDVSGSMRPHVQRIADASAQALGELGKDDRMGIMVFDRYTRVRLPLSSSKQEVQRASTGCSARSASMAEPTSHAPCSTQPTTFDSRAAATPAAPSLF